MSERQENYGTSGGWMALSIDAREIAEAVLDYLEERYFDFALLFDELRRKSEFYDMRTGIGAVVDELNKKIKNHEYQINHLKQKLQKVEGLREE